jgi:hypothetical protein
MNIFLFSVQELSLSNSHRQICIATLSQEVLAPKHPIHEQGRTDAGAPKA